MNFFKKALIAILSVGLVTVPATREVETVEAVNMTGGEVLYLKPNSNWTQANARFAIYVFGTGDAWASMTKDERRKDIYEVTVPSGDWTNVIFCRMNPSTNTNNWANKWNQTSDLTYDGTKNLYTVQEGAWDNGGGTWSNYEFEIVGTFNNWGNDPYEVEQLEYNEETDEFYLEKKYLYSDSENKLEFKIRTTGGWYYSFGISDVDEASKASYSGSDNIVLNKSGYYDIYLKSNGQIYIEQYYKINFIVDGVDNGHYYTLHDDGTFAAKEAPTKEGYTFAGWVDENNEVVTKVEDADTTLYASWTANTHNIKFNINGTIIEKTASYGEHATYPTAEELNAIGYNVVTWDNDLSSPVNGDLTVNATSYYPTTISEPTAELAFHYEYDERNDVVTTIDQVKLRMSSGYIDSSEFKGVTNYGISVTVGEKTNSEEWNESSVGKFTKDGDTYTEDLNGQYYKWSLILNNIPNEYYNTAITYSCYVEINGVDYVISTRTVTIKELAQKYTELEEGLTDIQKTTCEYLANIGYASTEEGIYDLLNAGVENIVLSNDVEVGELIINNKKVTIDLNGHSIIANDPQTHTYDNNTPDNPDDDYEYTSQYCIYAQNGAVVNIIGDGEVYGGTGADDNLAVRASGGSVVNIYGGTYHTGIEGEYGDGNDDSKGRGESTLYVTDTSIINIYGGTFSTEESYDGIYFVLNIEVGSEAQYNVYGGTFVNYNPENNYTRINFVENGYSVESTTVGEDTHYTVVRG